MSRPLISVTCSTFNRAHLLKRSVQAYNRLRFPLDRLEVVIVDDGSKDDTARVCEEFDSRITVKYIKLRKLDGRWTDCAFTLNEGIRSCRGHVVLLTHPEIMPGLLSLEHVADTQDHEYRCCKGYYLTVRDQERLDSVDWAGKGSLAVREIEGFYDPEPHQGGHPDYTPWAIEKVGRPGGNAQWESWIFGALTRRQLSHMGGWIRTDAWGATDLIFLQRRRQLGIQTVTGFDDETIVLHQNHNTPVGEFVPTDRDMQKCFAQTPYLTPEQCQYPAVNELWGPIP